MPWATREEHITALQNRLEFEQLDRATQLAVIDELAVLWKPADESTDAEKMQAMKRLQILAPPLWETAKTLLVELLTEKARQQLGL